MANLPDWNIQANLRNKSKHLPAQEKLFYKNIFSF